jgi:AraC family transcriptional regulator
MGRDDHRLEYRNRVNRVIDYVEQHRSEELSLETLAQVAAFSPFHFHRVFKSITGENLSEFVQRVRLEWAASALTVWRQKDVLEIALDAGFRSASGFARAFKERFGMSATQWRSGGAEAWSKDRRAARNLCQADSKPGKEPGEGAGHGDPRRGDGSPATTEEDAMNVTVKTMPAQTLAYMRYVGPYGAGGIGELWRRLMRWAGARDLWTADRVCLGVAHDDPRVTDPDKCRYDAGIVVPAGFAGDAQVNLTQVGAGKYATADFAGTAQDIGPCWDRLFSGWLPESGYQPGDGPSLEIYRGEAVDWKTGAFRCELCLPIKPL